jgi:hypothetical protein
VSCSATVLHTKATTNLVCIQSQSETIEHWLEELGVRKECTPFEEGFEGRVRVLDQMICVVVSVQCQSYLLKMPGALLDQIHRKAAKRHALTEVPLANEQIGRC